MTVKIETAPATPTDELELQDRFIEAGCSLVNEIMDDWGRKYPEQIQALGAMLDTGLLNMVAEVELSKGGDTFPASVHVYARWPDEKKELHLRW